MFILKLVNKYGAGYCYLKTEGQKFTFSTWTCHLNEVIKVSYKIALEHGKRMDEHSWDFYIVDERFIMENYLR